MRSFLAAAILLTALTFAGCNPGTNSGTNAATLGVSQGEGPLPSMPAAPGAIAPDNTKITFVGTKKDGKHDGGFKTFTGTINPAQGDFSASHVSLEINTESLYADVPKLTDHLKSPDFFDVKKYPKATFVSTSIAPSAKDGATHLIAGDLTLHGTTKSLTIPAKVTETEDALTLDATFTFDRTDYGIAYRPDMVDKVVTVKVSGKIPRK